MPTCLYVFINQFSLELVQWGFCACKQRLKHYPFKICFSSRTDLQKKSKEAYLNHHKAPHRLGQFEGF